MHRKHSHSGAFMTWALAIVLAAWAALSPTASCAQSERDAAARALVLETLAALRGPELYAELQNYMHTALVPVSRDITSGKIVIPRMQGDLEAEFEAEVLAAAPLLEKFAEELGVVLAKNREEIIADFARVLAKHFTLEEIEAVRVGLRQEASRKGLDAFYRLYHLALSINYEEEHSARLLNSWINQTTYQYKLRGNKPENATPTPERIAKASAIVSDILAKMHIDELVAAGIHFARVAVLPFDREDDKERLKAHIDRMEQDYRSGSVKPIMFTLLSTWLAQMATEDQMAQLEQHLRGPATLKISQMFVEFERAIAAVSPTDIDALKTYWNELQAKGLPKAREEAEIAAIGADMQALGEKWWPKLKDSISPDASTAVTRLIDRAIEQATRNAAQQGGLPQAQ